MTSKPDDLDAVRTIVDSLTPFDPDTQLRVVRWACEKLGINAPVPDSAMPAKSASVEDGVNHGEGHATTATHHKRGNMDIKSFIEDKSPSSNNEFAACVAYFYRFEAPDAVQKDSIDKDDLQEACRLAKRERLSAPGQTLINAHNVGLIDKADERGKYSISTVGENLVAMTLPTDGTGKRAQAAAGKKRAEKKGVNKKATKKKAKKKGS